MIKNLFPLIIETDSQVLTLLLQPSMNNVAYTNLLVHDCRFLIFAMDHPPVRHIYHEDNTAAQVLANYGRTWISQDNAKREEVFWATPHLFASLNFRKDLLGTVSIRSVTCCNNALNSCLQ